MEESFWHQRWQDNQIGFHLPAPNELLLKHLSALNLAPTARVFLPLCGKTRDIAWLLEQGHRVAGAELSELAVQQLFQELSLTPRATSHGALKLYQADKLDVWVGNILALTPQLLGAVDAIYDRAALVALPYEMRRQYAPLLIDLSHRAPQLLITFSYDQALHAGPPFSIDATEVNALYQGHYACQLLESRELPQGLKGLFPAQEEVWLLRP